MVAGILAADLLGGPIESARVREFLNLNPMKLARRSSRFRRFALGFWRSLRASLSVTREVSQVLAVSLYEDHEAGWAVWRRSGRAR